MSFKTALAWAVNRVKEPSTYAGIAAGAVAVTQVAQQAQGVATTFKEQGVMVGAVALSSAIMAILMSEKKKPAAPASDEPIEAEYTEVKKD